MIKNFILIWFVIVTFTAFTSCRSSDQSDNRGTHPNYDSTLIVVIPWDNYPFDSLYYSPTTLTGSDIEQIEGLLTEAVVKYNNSLSSRREEYKINLAIKDFKKQLIAVVNSKGEKEVWVNCFCHIDSDLWRKGIVLVADGGPCFFNCKVNLTTRVVYELRVNGVA